MAASYCRFSVARKPRRPMAAIICSTVTWAGSKATTASFDLRLTSAPFTPFSPSRAFLTATGQAPHVIPSTARSPPSRRSRRSRGRAIRRGRTPSVSSHSPHVVTGVRGIAAHQMREQVGRELRISVEHDGSRDDEGRHDEQGERDPTPGHPACKRFAPTPLPYIEDEPGHDADDAGRDQQPTVLHRRRHERAAAESEHDHGQRQQTAERGKGGPDPGDHASSEGGKSHGVLLHFGCERTVLEGQPVSLAATSYSVARFHTVW